MNEARKHPCLLFLHREQQLVKSIFEEVFQRKESQVGGGHHLQSVPSLPFWPFFSVLNSKHSNLSDAHIVITIDQPDTALDDLDLPD